jgi:hypothetical protein
MTATLLLIGLVCVIAAITGGGCKVYEIDLPVIASGKRQIVLALLGIVLLGVAYVNRTPPPAPVLPLAPPAPWPQTLTPNPTPEMPGKHAIPNRRVEEPPLPPSGLVSHCCDALGRPQCVIEQPLPAGFYCFCEPTGLSGPGLACR